MTKPIDFYDAYPSTRTFLEEVVEGLGKERKQLSPKWFYDERGSELFDKICELPEYYPTRTETAILSEMAREIDEALAPATLMIEYGSGASKKIYKLLESTRKISAYMPLDISKGFLLEAAQRIDHDFPRLKVFAVCADYTKLDRPPPMAQDYEERVVFFPGSTIGNLDHAEAVKLLRGTRRLLNGSGKLLIGIDLIKDEQVLIDAYNDRQGVTAAFNLNLLARINRELGGTFDLDAFEHRAIYVRELSRIEMHLVSRKDQEVSVAGQRFRFAEGESIHTENSHKFDQTTFSAMATDAGFELDKSWTDDKDYFAEMLFRTA